jgi:Poly(A) RNA polymerase, mitochondrial-like, central palm domain
MGRDSGERTPRAGRRQRSKNNNNRRKRRSSEGAEGADVEALMTVGEAGSPQVEGPEGVNGAVRQQQHQQQPPPQPPTPPVVVVSSVVSSSSELHGDLPPELPPATEAKGTFLSLLRDALGRRGGKPEESGSGADLGGENAPGEGIADYDSDEGEVQLSPSGGGTDEEKAGEDGSDGEDDDEEEEVMALNAEADEFIPIGFAQAVAKSAPRGGIGGGGSTHAAMARIKASVEDGSDGDDALFFGTLAAGNEGGANGDASAASASVEAESPTRAGTGLPAWISPDSDLSAMSLRDEVWDFVHYIQPTASERLMRADVIKRVKAAVSHLWPDAKLEVFGSYHTNLFLPFSDIDMVVLDCPEPAVSGIHALGSELLTREVADPETLQLLEKARVPLVKMHDTKSGCQVDVSFHQGNGPENSRMVATLLEEMPIARPLVLVLKYYLQQRGLNEGSSVFGGCVVLIPSRFLTFCFGLVVAFLKQSTRVESARMRLSLAWSAFCSATGTTTAWRTSRRTSGICSSTSSTSTGTSSTTSRRVRFRFVFLLQIFPTLMCSFLTLVCFLCVCVAGNTRLQRAERRRVLSKGGAANVAPDAAAAAESC